MRDHSTNEHAKRLRGRFGVGPQTAAIHVAVAGDNPERLKSEAALAVLCGASPFQASSGKNDTTPPEQRRRSIREQRLVDHRHGTDAKRSQNEGLR